MAPFETFLSEFGPPINPWKPEETFVQEFAKSLPPEMMEVWRTIGIASFHQGLLWITNPKQFESPMTEWFPKTSMRRLPLVVARTSFGKLIYWDREKFWLLDVNYNDTFSAGDNVEILFDFFLSSEDGRSAILNQTQFNRARRKLGLLKDDEMYGYKLPLALGGEPKLENMEKMKILEELSILAQIHRG